MLLPARDAFSLSAVVQGQWASTNLTNGMSLQTLGGAVLQVSTLMITVQLWSVQLRYSAADCCLPVTHTCLVQLACSMQLLSQLADVSPA